MLRLMQKMNFNHSSSSVDHRKSDESKWFTMGFSELFQPALKVRWAGSFYVLSAVFRPHHGQYQLDHLVFSSRFLK